VTGTKWSAKKSVSLYLKTFERSKSDNVFLLEAFDQYFSFLRKNANKLRASQRTGAEEMVSENKADMLADLLVGKQYKPLLDALHKDGIYSIRHYKSYFRNNSLMRYVNTRVPYAWKERIKIVEAVTSLLGGSVDVQDNSIQADDKKTGGKADDYLTVVFGDVRSYAHTKPRELIVHGRNIFVRSWTELLVAICDILMSENVEIARSLLDTPLVPTAARPYFSTIKKNLIQPKPFQNGMWVETNFSADAIVDLCKRLCALFGVALDNVEIRYYERNGVADIGQQAARDFGEGVMSVQSDVDEPRLESYLKSRGLSACSIDELIAGTDQPPRMRAAVMRTIEATPQIVEITRGRFIHRSSIVDMDEAAETLLDVLQTQFRQFDGYSNSRLLFDAARIDLSLFMNDNDFEDEATIYAIAKHLFSKEDFRGNHFVFHKSTHIWEKEPDYPKSMRGILMHRARLNGGMITRTECEAFLDRIKMGQGSFNQAIQSGDSTFYQYASGKYLMSETLHIDSIWQEQIKKALDDLFEDNSFIVPRDISEEWYNRLPKLPLDLTWTPLLLQEVLIYNHPINYKCIFAPLVQNRDTVAAAIVPQDSDMTFADVVSSYLNRVLELPKRMGVEDLRMLLREAGMLEGNELIYNMHNALDDYRFVLSDGNKTVYIHKG
jgi:hypothetical protein